MELQDGPSQRQDEEPSGNNPLSTSANSVKQTQSLKNLITDILRSNSAYDCMPINSSICSINKESSLFDAINIIVNENIEELLVWDEDSNRWIWMLTIVDAIRLILHALKTIVSEGRVNFTTFQKYRQQSLSVAVSQLDKNQILLMIETLQTQKISSIITQINLSPQESSRKSESQQASMEEEQPVDSVKLSAADLTYSQKRAPLPPSSQRPYIRLKSVVKESKLSYVIMAMIVEKIHRILIEDIDSKMIISILNFKDVLLYLLKIANESENTFYQHVSIGSLLDSVKVKNFSISDDRPLWEAFEAMADEHRSMWINVIDSRGAFKGILFREDFRDIFKGWHIDYLWMTTGEFIRLKSEKQQSKSGKIPDYRTFESHNVTKEIIWKIVMSKNNTIVWVDHEDGDNVKATIGLMELFSLFVH